MRAREYFDTLCNTGDGVFIVDEDKQIVRWNKGAERILKYSESEVLNQKCFRVVAGRISPEEIHCGPNCTVHKNVFAGACQKNFDLLTRDRGGEPVWINLSLLSPPNPNEPYLAHILRDVTREKQMAQALDNFLANLDTGSRIRQEKAETSAQATGKPAAILSEREFQVLTLLAEGLPTKVLAQRLNISYFTARNHIQNILVKLDLHSKAQAVSYAFRKGIL